MGRDDPTQLRPKVTEVSLPKGADPTPSTRSTRLLTLAGVGLLLVAASAGYWLVGRGHGEARLQPHVAASTGGAGTGAGTDDSIPPGPVTIAGKRSGTTAVFTLDYSAALSTDTYRWEVVGGEGGIARKPTVTVPAPAAKKICLRVIVVRADGSYATRDWSPEGCIP
jgi:hypothetical protein